MAAVEFFPDNYSYVVQELVFNAIDAKATCIAVRISEDFDFIQVVDNAKGLSSQHMQHVGTTIKLKKIEKIKIPAQYGINGRFLRDLASSCCSLEVVSRSAETGVTLKKKLLFGKASAVEIDTTRPSTGTTITVEGLWFNLSRRPETLRQSSCSQELLELDLLIQSLALLHPYISFTFQNITTGSYIASHTKKSSTEESLQDQIQSSSKFAELNHNNGIFRLHGYVLEKLHSSRKFQFVFVNKRLIQTTRVNRHIRDLLNKYFRGWLQLPTTDYKEIIFLVELFLPLSEFHLRFDLQKTYVKFRDDNLVARFLYDAIRTGFKAIQQNQVSKIVLRDRHSNCGLLTNPLKQYRPACKHRRTVGTTEESLVCQIIDDWTSPEPTSVTDMDAEIKQTPRLFTVDFESLSGSFHHNDVFQHDQQANKTESRFSEIKRPSLDSIFAPTKKLKITSTNHVIKERIDKLDEVEVLKCQPLWIPAVKEAARKSQYFARPQKPTFAKPTTGTDKMTELLDNWENPMFQNPISLLNASVTVNRMQPSKSCTFSKQSIGSCTILNQVDNKFIACLATDVTGKEHLVLVDQHAAHERIRLEMLTKHYSRCDPEGNLTSVKSSDVDPVFEVQTQHFGEYQEKFVDSLRKCGLHVRISGPCQAQVLAVPSCFLAKHASEVKHGRNFPHAQLVNELITEKFAEFVASRGGSCRPMSTVVRNILNSVACHGSIKFGDSLTVEECSQLLASLKGCENPFQCAHGRPVLSVLLETGDLKSDKRSRPKIHNLIRRFQS